ncbi:ninja-family protein AFP2-like [Andrographis paniculata]|uniref:ninja-family protein AFP2-like n=1 Tax=Andrographis paniculata TaxID=175694 RepID=UPI0021E7F0BB|nr:ninja-family protein AFP2-like [Andrographis paniculata]XP_051149486.1 ninja-family protein AFP2-like [Andrographis paniculata]
MGDRDEKKISKTLGMDNLSLSIPMNQFSRDLLQRFMGSVGESGTVSEEDGEVELNLGLSLGGRFGVDRSSSTLKRSSSIASCLPLVRDDNSDAAASTAAPQYTGLARTSSLPLEAEEEWRNRKERQTLRRMEAKRRRSEKQRSLKGEKGGEGNGGSRSSGFEVKKEIDLREKFLASVKKTDSGGGLDVIVVKGKGRCVGTEWNHGFGNLPSQGSVESKGGSSSNLSDLGSKTPQGSSGEPSPPAAQSAQEPHNLDSATSASKTRETMTITTGSKPESTCKKATTSTATQGARPLEDMPFVFTKGDGPNGRRVEGILYKYSKGQEVRIMCICHGTFHSPAEFITHAGGTAVDHPLKHIVVNPNTAPLV